MKSFFSRIVFFVCFLQLGIGIASYSNFLSDAKIFNENTHSFNSKENIKKDVFANGFSFHKVEKIQKDSSFFWFLEEDEKENKHFVFLDSNNGTSIIENHFSNFDVFTKLLIPQEYFGKKLISNSLSLNIQFCNFRI